MKPRRIRLFNPDLDYERPAWHLYHNPARRGCYIVCVQDNGGEVEVDVDIFDGEKWESYCSSDPLEDRVYAWSEFPLIHDWPIESSGCVGCGTYKRIE